MKLRNKKTGEIFDALVREKGGGGSYSLIVCDIKAYEQSKSTLDQTHFVLDEYETLAEFNDEWEDYKPAEPLIKDEKKLDTVKSFFALLGISNEIYYQSINKCFYKTDDDGITYGIDFDDDKGIDNICTGLPYTITELCGEEEE